MPRLDAIRFSAIFYAGFVDHGEEFYAYRVRLSLIIWLVAIDLPPAKASVKGELLWIVASDVFKCRYRPWAIEAE